MLERLHPRQTDPIINLMQAFREDPREDKIDLGVGVYRTEDGQTPVFAAVKEAERMIWESQTTKGYVGLAGDPEFLDAIRALVLGTPVTKERIASVATCGGTSAVRQIADLIRLANPDATVWLPDPTWPNHPAIMGYVGLRQRVFRYYDRTTGGVDRDGMFADLSTAQPGDVVLLHACCHNPTGADLTLSDWDDLAKLFQRTGATPFVDSAYQGFGAGLEDDVAGLRQLAGQVPEMLVAVSGAKNFGLYRERAAAVLAICPDAANVAATGTNLAWLNRQNYTFPPDHGARIVSTILNDTALRTSWEGELATMRVRIGANRRAFADKLAYAVGPDRFAGLDAQQGMFSILGFDEGTLTRLREDHGVYMVADGRINIAGLTAANTDRVVAAISEVLKA